MDWQSDPELEVREMERRARNGLIRTAVIWTPIFLIAFGGLLYILFDRLVLGGNAGTWFFVGVLAVFSFLFGYQSLHALRDLRHGPSTTEGFVTRRWARSDSLVIRSHYIRLDVGGIYRIDKLFHDDVKPADYVHLRYYPRSAVVIQCNKIEPPEGRTPPIDPRKRPPVRSGFDPED